MPDLKNVRVYTPAEIKARQDHNRSQKQPKRNRDPGEIVRRPNRKKNKFRYCVSLSPKIAMFLRLQYGGDDNSLSLGIERSATILYHLSKESPPDEPFSGIVSVSKKTRKAMEDIK
jgi:hypothetical protein